MWQFMNVTYQFVFHSEACVFFRKRCLSILLKNEQQIIQKAASARSRIRISYTCFTLIVNFTRRITEYRIMYKQAFPAPRSEKTPKLYTFHYQTCGSTCQKT